MVVGSSINYNFFTSGFGLDSCNHYSAATLQNYIKTTNDECNLPQTFYRQKNTSPLSSSLTALKLVPQQTGGRFGARFWLIFDSFLAPGASKRCSEKRRENRLEFWIDFCRFWAPLGPCKITKNNQKYAFLASRKAVRIRVGRRRRFLTIFD